MAEVTKAMIYEVLMAVQTLVGRVEERVRETSAEIKGLCGTIGALQAQVGVFRTGVADLCETHVAIDLRLSRIERRLDIIDVPAT